MKILLIGPGGRESALAWKLSQSSLVEEIIVSPGNGGMPNISRKISLLTVNDKEEWLALSPDLVVVGPEAYLAEGIVDYFEKNNVLVVGPGFAATKLESSKDFCKEVLVAADIPTSDYEVVTSVEEGLKIIEKWPQQEMVIKVDSLAQGKGVVVAKNKQEASEALREFFSGVFLGYPVEKIVIEDFVEGVEASAFAICDGKNFVYLGSASDYKRLSDGDEGPNTGGMGTVSPSPILTQDDETWIKNRVFAPLMDTMCQLGTPYKGFLFAGLMKTADGGFSVLEFNVRMGDPETQSLLPRLQGDIVPLLIASARGKLDEVEFLDAPKDLHAVHVVMTARGYPGVKGEALKKGDPVHVEKISPESYFFPAGVSQIDRGLFTNGGRVCGVTSLGASLAEARQRAYQEIQKVSFEGAHYRKDIGEKFL